MNGFKFRGAKLLDWRRLQEDQARVAFMRAAASARETADLLERAEASAGDSVREFLEVMRSAIDVATIERYRNWIAVLRLRVTACQRTHAERQLLAEQAGVALQAAMRNVKIMERLRDRAERRHRESERQLEMKVINELATMRFARRQATQGATRD
jgi:flagellar export protein FliJ